MNDVIKEGYYNFEKCFSCNIINSIPTSIVNLFICAFLPCTQQELKRHFKVPVPVLVNVFLALNTH